MRDPNLPADLRIDMAKSAAPFVHTRRKERTLNLQKPSIVGSPPASLSGAKRAGLTLRHSRPASYSSTGKMDEGLNGGKVAGGDDLSPLDYLLTVMNDAGAMPELQIKAARIAAPYLHSPPPPDKMEIVIEDPYGFDFDPAVARALRDAELKVEVMYATRHLRPGEDHNQKEREVRDRIHELIGMLPKRHPPGYTRLQAMADRKRIDELHDLRWSQHKLSKEDDAEEAHLNARFQIHWMTYAATPEARGRKRIDELRGHAPLSDAERHELEELLKLYPPLPKPPENRVKRAMLDYIEKSKREAAQRLAERQEQRQAR